MNRDLVDKLAATLLYEGYVLYPYRPSVKNQQRWTFGGIYPQAWTETQNGAEPCVMQTECLLEGKSAKVRAIVRFLHLIDRTIGESKDAESFQPVDSLEIDGRLYRPWQEAAEREIDLGEFEIDELAKGIKKEVFFNANCNREMIRSGDGQIAGIIERNQKSIELSVEISATPLDDRAFKLTVKIINRTPISDANNVSRDEALLSSLVSTHTILGIESGKFISLTDPPEAYKEFATACKNIGAWPVLVGKEPQRDTILSSPIILSDYPELAPESPGDLFDATEIDEILTLRIMTLTDEEKKTAAAVDERVRQLLQRTESLERQQMANLHGAIRSMRLVAREEQS